MAFRNLFVENAVHISGKLEQLCIKTSAVRTVPIEDISAIIIENTQSTITTAALAALAQNGVAVYFCDEKHMPCGVMLPYQQHTRQQAVISAQIAVKKPAAKRLWQEIVVAKITNQAACLKLCGKSEGALHLAARASAVNSGDTANQEAVAAAYYFPALFGTGFTRGSTDARNAALNYGYAILRGFVARTLAVYGFLPSIGIHHCSALNQFNLADDLMEPFRPVVDIFVATNIDEDTFLTPSLKHELLNLLQYDIMSGGQRHSMAYAIERLVHSLSRCMAEKGEGLVLPKLVELRLHTYE